MVTVPAATPAARPGSTPAEVWMDASAGFEDDQEAESVRLADEPSL